LKILIGFLTALLISIAARRAKALSHSGAVAAAILGTVIFGLGGTGWAATLLGFFISSSALSRLLSGEKTSLNEKFSKDSTRDASQVFANGGIAGLMVLAQLLFPETDWPWIGFTGALAAANADTWSTELGVLSTKSPRLITTGKSVERGTSGGITLTGTLASLGGGLLIALLLGVISLAGLTGSLVDSLLGATVQAIYLCPVCAKETEHHPTHTCGSETILKRGWSWLNNDLVNTFCTLSGACAGILLRLL
ncbi:MAG: DUF92 domain-containing protein, partial [Anaerolineaceae bacterium]|nr:DUF92 domain-containing protein [Anaerolineaceae bacterium]